jgi:hypothetical protein
MIQRSSRPILKSSRLEFVNTPTLSLDETMLNWIPHASLLVVAVAVAAVAFVVVAVLVVLDSWVDRSRVCLDHNSYFVGDILDGYHLAAVESVAQTVSNLADRRDMAHRHVAASVHSQVDIFLEEAAAADQILSVDIAAEEDTLIVEDNLGSLHSCVVLLDLLEQAERYHIFQIMNTLK